MSADKAQVLVATLVNSHGTQLRSYLSRRVRNSADVPDLVQEVYLRMLRVPDHDAIRSPEAYLFTIAHHVARQHAIRQAHIGRPTELHEMLAELAEVTNDPAGEISAQQSLHEIEQALQHLSARERATFIYHRSEGLTLQDVAERLGVSRHMVKKYLAKAVFELRKHLSETE